MRRTLSILFILCVISSFAQEKASNFTGRDEDRSRNPRMDQMNYVPNEILLKFKDEITVVKGSRVKAAGVNNVDNVLQSYGVNSLEKLFPTVKKPLKPMRVKGPQGKEVKIPRIDNIYRISIPQDERAMPTNIHQVIEELKALPEIEYAEPNYIYSIDDMQPVGPELTADDLAKMAKQYKSDAGGVTPNDPLYPQQWYIPAVKADLVWEQTTGDSTQVIAILDTGVDWTHPDLKNKIWRNPGEISDNGMDDDGNGFIDDYMGWDFINNDNNPMDDNSHGTHVAGIAAAEANNGIGIAGVNWHAKIMPIKVFQSSGRGDAATITQGIVYAYQNGATVINMSFGSYAKSSAMENVLANAYTTCILVAAAGNDNIYIGPNNDCINRPGYPFFPAALSFVLGVSDGSNCGLGFGNYDDDPVFSEYNEWLNYNYELNAPGSSILSLIPGGNYRQYNGTSMATPIISGIVSLYKVLKSDDSQELMWGNLIHTSKNLVNAYEAINIIPSPKLMIINKNIVDTLPGCNRDGIINAGETIELWITAKNAWGQCDSVTVNLDFGEFEDTSTATILNNNILLGSVSSYAKITNQLNPFKITINKNVAHDRDIRFLLSLYYPNAPDTVRKEITLRISNGSELSGILLRDTTLTADKFWLINKSLRIGQGVTVNIEPGTNIEISSDVDNRGQLHAIGTKDSLITMKGYIGGNSLYEYANIDLLGQKYFVSNNSIKNCYLFNAYVEQMIAMDGQFNVNIIENCVLEDFYINNGIVPYFSDSISVITNSIIRNSTFSCLTNAYNNMIIDKSLFYNIKLNRPYSASVWESFGGNGSGYGYNTIRYTVFDKMAASDLVILHRASENSYGNSFLSRSSNMYFASTSGPNDMLNYPDNYWGSSKLEIIEEKYYDFIQDVRRPYMNIEAKLNAPSDSCHAHVWKILVNSKDAQDEVVEPVGVGKHRFDVYFNRAMDKTIIPQLSFGVRYPYTQQSINEGGSWSEDGKIYTAYKTIKLTTGDGINKVRVAGAKELDGWDFEIPVEDSRFEFVIAAASSASTEFMATPGLGKVELEWNDNDLEDGLGYNMYRMDHINDSTLTEPVIVNSSLITDTLYTDFNVVPKEKYYYYYKILRTNMVETDSSRVVAAIPFTAAKGDANGDLTVDVLDVTTIVSYLLNKNPQPFIYEAADVNNDEIIDVLDIVGVVNLVLDVPQHAPAIAMTKRVDLYMQNDTLFADSNVDIGAIQLDILGIESFENIEVLDALKAFESGNNYANESLRVIFYSMSGQTIESGQAIPLLKLKAGGTINHAVFGEPTGSSIPVNYIKTRIPDIRANMNQNIAELGQNYPNPANGLTTIPIRIYEPVDEIVLRVVNVIGQEVDVVHIKNPLLGENLIHWNPVNNKGLLMYKLEIRQGNSRSVCPAKRMMIQQ